MGRAPCCDKTKVKKGPWSLEEDQVLKNFVAIYGNGGNWISLPKRIGLNRCGKSCRLRWLNYLRPNIKHGDFTEDEDQIIHTLYNIVGSRWSIIASKLQGRTDNDVKNYWNTKLKKKISASRFTKNIPIKTEITDNHFSVQAYINTNYNSQNIDLFSKLDQQTHFTSIQQESDEKYSESNTYNVSRSSSMTQVEVSSQYSSYSTNDNMSNVQENDKFWMDLFSESFDDVVVGSQLVDDKINEIASLLNVFVD